MLPAGTGCSLDPPQNPQEGDPQLSLVSKGRVRAQQGEPGLPYLHVLRCVPRLELGQTMKNNPVTLTRCCSPLQKKKCCGEGTIKAWNRSAASPAARVGGVKHVLAPREGSGTEGLYFSSWP